jgi:hypothetical protein
VAVFATVALLVGLVVRPEISMTILWNVLIPLVPASLLVTPVLWRNICPLATLNVVGNGLLGARRINNGWLLRAGLVGMLLLAVLVPARRFVFNTDGTTLAITIAAVAGLALVLGAFFDAKAGFCNSICPVLPVERLYGQRPLIELSNPRCSTCTLCTAKGCIDLSPPQSIPATLGQARSRATWLLTAYGAFAASFPGFVLGYFTLTDGSWSTAGAVYLHMVLWSVASYAATAVVALTLRLPAASATVLLGAAAAAIYYWYAATAIASALALPDIAALTIRVLAGGLIVFWAYRGLAGSSRPRRVVAIS